MKVFRFLPYIEIGLLVITIVIWVIFGIKKFRWAKVIAIILTVIVVVTGVLSFIPHFLQREIVAVAGELVSSLLPQLRQ